MKRLLFFIVLLMAVSLSRAQSNESFAREIANYKHQDSLHFPPKNAILFVGSSSFRKWTDVQDYFPDFTVINRGFGGSQLQNVIFYANKIIYPYHPKQILIYCGDNDFAYDKTVSAETVFNRFKTLFFQIRKHLPKANIGFLAIKYSPSRERLWSKMKRTNQLAQNFLANQRNAEFIDITKGMFDKNGKVITSIYQNDMLHLNPAGYKIWQSDILPYLLK
ncbi:GDSL-type esterase/lipase family protein [Arachidicoccus sp.]|uniref:GDSL-type esterase/lipase family protein n=1 Tax=Arachidicoccus sp. TaxID=1872624 RepID=UPI003D1B0796